MFSLVAHWLACIWYVIAIEEIEVNSDDWDVSEYCPLILFSSRRSKSHSKTVLPLSSLNIKISPVVPWMMTSK